MIQPPTHQSTFLPSEIVWFHAVNTEEVWKHAVLKMERILSDSSALKLLGSTEALPICFGIECDIRLIDEEHCFSESSSAPSSNSRLLLAHDPIASAACWVFPKDDQQNIVIINDITHLTLEGLIDRLAAFTSAITSQSQCHHSFTFILKLDVKDITALPHLFSLLRGESAEADGTYKDLIFGPLAKGGLNLPRTQVWLNMDVVPFAPPVVCEEINSQPSTSLPSTSAPLVADLAIPYFKAAVSEFGLGLSLGWQISPLIAPWLRDPLTPPSAAEIKRCYEEGNIRMNNFLKEVFSPSVNDTETLQEEGRHNKGSNLVTFALNFALFICNPIGMAALRDLATSTESLLKGLGIALTFPTFWRSRADVLSDTDRARLIADCAAIGLQCSVDQE